MSIPYISKIIHVDETARAMQVEYTSPGHETMVIGMRLPFADESIEDVIRAYSPVVLWSNAVRPVAVPQVGQTLVFSDPPVVQPELDLPPAPPAEIVIEPIQL